MVAQLVSCDIDSEQKCVLTKITKTRKESDHNSIVTKFNIECKNEIKIEKIEIFNFKDDIGMKKLKEITSNNTTLSLIFDTQKSIEIQTRSF